MLTSLGDTDIGLGVGDLRDIGDVLLGSGEGGMGESGGMLAKYLWKKKCENRVRSWMLAGISMSIRKIP
jgi:hypothetical protein